MLELARCFGEINQVRQKRLSGQQGLNLLRGPGHKVLWVFVAISWAGQCCVDLSIGPAHQLCRLTENLLPAQTDKTLQIFILSKQSHSNERVF